MAVEGLFFDSQAGDRVYNAADWETIFESLFNDGVMPGLEGEMAVTEKTPTDMSVDVAVGRAMVGGKMFTVTNSSENLPVAGNSSGSPRKDLVVARIDYTNRVGTLAVVQGTPDASNPQPPAVTQDATKWEIPLAEVHVANGAVQILNADITDRRIFSTSEASVPRGTIVMWSGGTSNVPVGWLLCNGSNGTPDLRGKFIVGAGGSYSTGAQGGAESVTLTASQMPGHTHSGPNHSHSTPNHSHTASSANDSHNHGSSGAHAHNVKGVRPNTGTLTNIKPSMVYNAGDVHTNSYSESFGVETTGSGHTHTTDTHNHGITVNSGGGGTSGAAGTGNTGSTGGGASHENRPPYYALAYIMKA